MLIKDNGNGFTDIFDLLMLHLILYPNYHMERYGNGYRIYIVLNKLNYRAV